MPTTVLPSARNCVTVPLEEIKRGATISGRTFAYANAGGPLEIIAARFSVARGDNVIYTQTCAFAAGVVTLADIPGSENETWPEVVTWGVKILRAGNIEREYTIGSWKLTYTPQPKGAPLPIIP